MGEGNVFSPSTPRGDTPARSDEGVSQPCLIGGEGVPQPSPTGGVTPARSDGGVNPARSDWGVPQPGLMGVPHQGPRGGIPQPGLTGGTTARSVWWG